ncbi:MAG: Stp1/IreP family PP2C-type Ser/Thr phosphatase [Gammaproteobacteria bacterium]|nr:Stp1/IreP family PP2C-type Ser/Thr phosphatase [Gammaproteobacteria bacterium]NNM20418.1 Stp1/IreP family PP2C-type Ser/Thr phosphatase [Gammaproteobacteria bacterium]
MIELSDTGKVREHNEDAVGSDLDVGLLVLADGMGGYNAGEVASGMAVKTTVDMVRQGLKRENRNEIDKTTGLRRQSIILRDSILRANKIIYQTSKSQPQCEGMGTTIVACLFYDNRVSVAHVGDSRIYRLRNRQFQQITQDHSLLQELVDRGFYSPEEAQRSLNRNYVTRALGIEPTVEVEVNEESVRPDDLYVLCSDGLSDMVDDEDIHLTISTFNGNLDMIGKQLVQLTNDNGGRDNVSVVLARVLKSFEASKGLFGKISSLFN